MACIAQGDPMNGDCMLQASWGSKTAAAEFFKDFRFATDF